MWKKILVAVDLSPTAQIVFKQALKLAKSTGASLIVLQVLSHDEEGPANPILYSIEYPIMPEVYQKIIETNQKQWEVYQKKAFATLEAMKNEAIKEDVNIEIMQIFGSPGKTICQQQQKLAVDLIVIGNRGLSSIQELFLGSVSNYVTHRATCSVLVVRNPNRSIKT